MADEIKVPEEGETKKEEVKEPPKPPISEPTDDIPDKFRGKTTADIAKSYLELEKTLGDRPTKEDFEKANVNLAQWEALGEVIRKNPALLKAIEEQVKGDTAPDPEKKDDVRESLTIRTISEFESRLGIDTLPQEQRTALHVKIGNELKELLDPDGKKTTQQIIQEIPLDRLPSYLNKAYKLATGDDDKEKARLEGLIQARQNGEATFGNIPSNSSKNEEGLSPEQRDASKKLGVSEENYLKQLKKEQAN